MATLPTPRIDRRGLAALGELLEQAGARRAFVICGPGARYLDRIERALPGRALEPFAEARRHVPRVLVERASAALAVSHADVVISIGGGSATGLGKALRLEHAFYFIAVPTTYAGSELTDLYGVTSDGGKRTGRDPRVVPDVALYDLGLTLDMPLGLSVTSLMNAFAHPLSALSTRELDAAGSEGALVAAEVAHAALRAILRDARDEAGRRAAIDATIAAGDVLRSSPLGVHHELAHALGGRFDLDHAGLHSVLLPHSIAELAGSAPEALAQLEGRLHEASLARAAYAWLEASGAPRSLSALGVTREGLEALLAERPHLARATLMRAFEGQQP